MEVENFHQEISMFYVSLFAELEDDSIFKTIEMCRFTHLTRKL